MKRPIVMAVSLLLLSLLFISCGKGELSKSEAKKQIEEQLSKMPDQPTFYMPQYFWDVGNAEKNALYEIVGEKFVDYTKVDFVENTPQGYPETKHYCKVRILEKAKPFFIQNSFHDGLSECFDFKAGSYSAEVISITEPGSSSSGKTTCHVEYICKFIPNELFKTFSKVENRYAHTDAREIKYNARFVKTQDGWKLQE